MWPSLNTFLHHGVIALLFKGGVIMIPLLVASLLSVAVVLERLHFWWRLRQPAMDETILALTAEGKLEEALRVAGRSLHPVARVLAAGLAAKHRSSGLAMQAAAQAEVREARRALPVLDTVITLAPLLGLLGTITGMISAFGIVSEAGLGQPQAVTGGIAEALIATATGLLIAIMTLIPYNYLRAKVEQLTDRLEEQATRLERLLTPPEG
jgi:biopolymer transport protein ExbB